MCFDFRLVQTIERILQRGGKFRRFGGMHSIVAPELILNGEFEIVKVLFVLEEGIELAGCAIGIRRLGTGHFDFFLGAEVWRCQNTVDIEDEDDSRNQGAHVKEGDVIIVRPEVVEVVVLDIVVHISIRWRGAGRFDKSSMAVFIPVGWDLCHIVSMMTLGSWQSLDLLTLSPSRLRSSCHPVQAAYVILV